MSAVDRTNKGKGSATLISFKNKKSIEEALHPFPTKAMEKVRKREKNNSGFTDIGDIDWDEL